jgi:hypothetical protein
MVSSPPGAYLLASISLFALQVRTAPGILGDHRVEVVNDELTDATQVNRTTWRLSCVLEVYTGKRVVVVSLPGGNFRAIPRTADFGADTFDSFAEALAAAVRRCKAAG